MEYQSEGPLKTSPPIMSVIWLIEGPPKTSPLIMSVIRLKINL